MFYVDDFAKRERLLKLESLKAKVENGSGGRQLAALFYFDG
jgi:hypothetical protein